ncbi:MAG: hypothetical protein ACREX3_05850 [Gammaproteobacteria bacterium]
MAEVLRNKDFDVAGVQVDRDGPVVGCVAAEALRDGLVRDHQRALMVDELISDATPLPNVLSVLKVREHTFVLIGSAVRGIITRADLNKPPVRVYLFGLISLLEMHLGFWIRATYRDESWERRLSATRLAVARELQAKRRERNQNISLIDCLQFCDKRDLVLARNELVEKLQLGGRTGSRKFFNRAEGLRDLLAHSQQDLDEGTSWESVIDLVDWIERTLLTSDDQVEEVARGATQSGEDTLWAAV